MSAVGRMLLSLATPSEEGALYTDLATCARIGRASGWTLRAVSDYARRIGIVVWA